MSIQNNESEKHRKQKRRLRFRKLTGASGTPGDMKEVTPLTEMVARLIEAWRVRPKPEADNILAAKLHLAPSSLPQYVERSLGVGAKSARGIASGLGISLAALHQLADAAAKSHYVGIEMLFVRLAGDKNAALPWSVPKEGLTVEEREMYEDALRLLATMADSGKLTPGTRKEAGDLVIRAKALGSEHRIAAAKAPAKPVKRQK